MWFDDATGRILECGRGPWGLMLVNPRYWKENVKFLTNRNMIQYHQTNETNCTLML
jgi:hypothetical protein